MPYSDRGVGIGGYASPPPYAKPSPKNIGDRKSEKLKAKKEKELERIKLKKKEKK